MKAVSVHEFGLGKSSRRRRRPRAEAGAGQVLVKVGRAGVNPLEISIRAGEHPVRSR